MLQPPNSPLAIHFLLKNGYKDRNKRGQPNSCNSEVSTSPSDVHQVTVIPLLASLTVSEELLCLRPLAQILNNIMLRSAMLLSESLHVWGMFLICASYHTMGQILL